jgi:hypothetical protein
MLQQQGTAIDQKCCSSRGQQLIRNGAAAGDSKRSEMLLQQGTASDQKCCSSSRGYDVVTPKQAENKATQHIISDTNTARETST